MKLFAAFMVGLVLVKDILLNIAIICLATCMICLFGFGTYDQIKEVYQNWRNTGTPKRRASAA